MLIDTHSHLYDEAFDADREAVLERARTAGIGKIFLPNINADTLQSMLHALNLYLRFPDLFDRCLALSGIYNASYCFGEYMDEVVYRNSPTDYMPNLPADHPFIAIGEVGLDYYWDRSLYAEQQEAFAIQVDWALQYDLPLMIHTRSAHREIVDILQEQMINGKSVNCKLHGVFHCFGGTADEAEELLHFDGFCFGIGGVLTYKKSQLPEVLRSVVPLTRIVIETDSPYLAPVPHRGKRNESAFVTEVVRRLSEIYDVSMQEVAETTTQNALRTFPRVQ